MTAAASKRLARFAWGVLGWNLVVILWGAFVRATGSGAGCGRHWPLCNGQVVPRAPAVETVIELTHRLTSGIALVLGVWLVVRAYRERPAGDPTRRAAVLALVLLAIEAAIGAGLVLLELVAGNASIARAVYMAGHLLNTFLLLAALVATALAADGVGRIDLSRRAGEAGRWIAGLALLALVGASGAVTALGDTLFPATDLASGVAADLDPSSHPFVRLRTIHPLLAIAVAALFVFDALERLRQERAPGIRAAAKAIVALAFAQTLLGTANIALLAPAPLQLAHLLLADLLWIAAVASGLLRFATPRAN